MSFQQIILDSFRKIKDVTDTLLGQAASWSLLVVIVVAALLWAAGQQFPQAAELTNLALFLCALFGVIVAVFGIFTHQTVVGLGLQKGFVVGLIAGGLAAITGGAAYYGFRYGCCTPEWEVKLFRLLAGSFAVGGILGALMGRLRPSGPAPVPSPPETSDVWAVKFLAFLLGLFLLLILCVSFFYIFDNMRGIVGDTSHPQGLLRVWHVSVLVTAFVVFYVYLVVHLYGRADGPADEATRRSHAISSAVAALACAVLLFGALSLVFGSDDFEPRGSAIVCSISSATSPCTDCISASGDKICRGDPTGENSGGAILLRTIFLAMALGITYLLATHPRSPLPTWIDKNRWLARMRS